MEDIIGKQFGALKVLSLDKMERHPKWNRFVYHYRCECKCGNVKNIVRSNLVTGHTGSCGCLKRRYGSANPTFYGFGEIGSRFWGSIKNKAESRNLSFDISIEEAWQKFEDQGRCCALTGTPINFIVSNDSKSKTASLDRIDSNKGYVRGNIQWVHKNINWMKGVFSTERFIELCRMVSDHNPK